MTIKNRFVVAPLTIYESDANGGLTDAARNFWRDRFRGFGLFVMPFTNVHPTGIGFPSPNAFDASHLPTLRERRSDIPELVAYFMHRINRETGKNVNLTTEAVEQLQYYSWPGNVFELERFLHELAKQSEGNIADEHQVWRLLNLQSAKPVPAVAPKPAQRAKKRRLRHSGQPSAAVPPSRFPFAGKNRRNAGLLPGQQTQAAQMLGLSTRQLYYRLESMKEKKAR